MKQKISLGIGVFLACWVWAIPFEALTLQAHHLAAIMTLVVVYWILEPLPLPATGLLGVGLAVLFGVVPLRQVHFAFFDQILFLFIGTFLLAKGMQQHGLDRRMAYRLLSHPWVGTSSSRMLWAMGLVAWLLAMWVSITACVAMLFPVALAVAKEKNQPRFTTALLLMLAYASAAGAMATPVGTPPNLIGMALIKEGLGIEIRFLSWMAFGLPLAALLLVSRYGLVRLLFPFKEERFPVNGVWDPLQEGPGPWTRGQVNSLIAFIMAVVLWMSGFLEPGVSALLAAGLLFVLPVDWRKRQWTLTGRDALRIDWGTILLFGCGIALGRMMLETGLAAVVGDALIGRLAQGHPSFLIGGSVFISTVISELASNTASANMVIPVLMSAAEPSQGLGLLVALAATLGTSLGFMLPVSTPAMAILYASKAIRMKDMVKTGLWVDLTSIVILWAFIGWAMPFWMAWFFPA